MCPASTMTPVAERTRDEAKVRRMRTIREMLVSDQGQFDQILSATPERLAKLLTPRQMLDLANASPEEMRQCAAELVRETPTKVLRDGTIGWYVRVPRADDCWCAAVSSCLQVPIDEIPDPEIDRRLAAGDSPRQINRDAWFEFLSWLSQRGLRMIVHRKVPARRARWLGIVEQPDGIFQDHTLLMSYGELLFDPAVDAAEVFGGRPDRRLVRRFHPKNVTYGLSFQAIRKE